jgi:putative ABC transport system permease protein
MRPLIGERRRVEAPIVDIVQSYLGLSAYADIEYLSGLIGEEWVANTLLATSFGEGGWDAMYRDLKERPTVVGLSRRERAFEQMEATFGKTQGTVIWILILLAGLIAFGSVLNTALVSLSERIREVGTLRVLGYSAGEVAAILRGEQVILSCVGIATGLVVGTVLSHAMSLAYDTELFRFPAIVRSIRYIHAVGLMIVFVGLAQLTIYGYIRRVNWLDALKIKE